MWNIGGIVMKRAIIILLATILISAIPFNVMAESDMKVNKVACGDSAILSIDSKGELHKTNSKGKTKYILSNVTDASAYFNYGALRKNGDLYLWGDDSGNNNYGQIGFELDPSIYVPTFVMEGVKSFEVCGYYSVALKKDGSLWTWGRNEYGQLGDGYKSDVGRNPQKQILTDVKFFDISNCHVAAVKKDGSLWMWGQNYYKQIIGNKDSVPSYYKPEEIKTISNISDISLAEKYSAALKNDNTLWVWGTLKGKTYKKPTKIASSVKSISAGDAFLAYITKDGKLWIRSASDSVNYSKSTFIMTKAKAVSASTNKLAVIRTDGTLWSGTVVNHKIRFKQIMDTTTPTLSAIKQFKAAAGKKKLIAKWKKSSSSEQKKFTGYQLQYSTDINFTKTVKNLTTTKRSASKVVIRDLKSHKKYYVRIRRYKKTNTGKIYSKWSKTITVKIK